jgi:hypothetical protein
MFASVENEHHESVVNQQDVIQWTNQSRQKDVRMWRTSTGDRTLTGCEAHLVLLGIGHLRDMVTSAVEQGEPHQTSVDLFNRLQPTQQLAILHEVAFALLRENVPDPELTATREATVYVLFRELLELVEVEIQWAEGKEVTNTTIRQAIVHSLREVRNKDSEWVEFESEDLNGNTIADLIAPQSIDLQAWESSLEELANQILWDRDFELESVFADHDPAEINELKEYLGISSDYFSIPAPDSDSEEYRRLDRELVQLSPR